MPPFIKQLLNRHARPQAIISPRLREWFEPEARQSPDRPFAQRGLLDGGNAAALAGIGGYGGPGHYSAFGHYGASGDDNVNGELGVTRDHNAPAGHNASGEYGAPEHGTLGSESRGPYPDGMDATDPATQPANTRAPKAAMPGQQPEPNLASKASRTLTAAAPIAYPNVGTLRNGESWTGAASKSSDPGQSKAGDPGLMGTPGENVIPPTVQPSGVEALPPLAKGKYAQGPATYVQPIVADRLKIAFPGSSRPTQQQAAANDTTVIKVSIGRIEIKAITAPQPPPAKRREPQKPKLSLEDFLSSRKSSQP